jgi:site-specific recombinase XerD
LKCPTKIPDYLSENDLGKAIAHLITHHSKLIYSAKAEALLTFLYYSGVRKAELLGLKRTDFDLNECVAKVYGKGKKERLIYYPKKVSEILSTYFSSEVEQGNAFNISLYDINYISKILKNCFPKFTIHLMRHSGARDMMRKGLDIRMVSHILGHSSIQTTMRYVDPNEDEIRKTYQSKMK